MMSSRDPRALSAWQAVRILRSARAVAMLLVTLCGTLLPAQYTSAYRVLGQSDFARGGTNMVVGAEMGEPGGIALDTRATPVHVYVSDSRNNRVLGWQDAAAFHNGDPATLALGQPDLYSVNPLGTGPNGLFSPAGLAVDLLTGDLYVADFNNNRVLRFPKPFDAPRRIEPDAVYGQVDFTGRNPNPAGVNERGLRNPRAVALDPAGNLWVSDSGNNRILRWSRSALDQANPAATAVIGQKDFNSAGANRSGAISASGFNTPAGIAFDSSGALYVADALNARILRFDAPSAQPDAAATVVLGQTAMNTRGVSTPATAATVAGPVGIAVDRAGNVYVADAAANRLEIFAAPKTSGPAARDIIGQPDASGMQPNAGTAPHSTDAGLFGPSAVAADESGNAYVADTLNNRVVVFPAGAKNASRVLGQRDLTANGPNQVKAGSLNAPYKAAVDYSRAPFSLYVSDANNNRVLVWRDVTAFRNGADADLVIGQPDLFSSAANADAGARASASSLSGPRGIAVDSDGTLYVADTGNNRVLRFPRPVDQTGRIAADAVIGQPDFASTSAQLASAVSLRAPAAVAIGPDGALLVADTGNNRVLEFPRAVMRASRVYGQPSFTAGSSPAAASAQTLSRPQGLAVDSAFNVYVADTGANRVIVYTSTRSLPDSGSSGSTVMGQNAFDAAAPGVGAARLRAPVDVSLDSAGDIFVSDSGNNRVLVFPSLLFALPTGSSATAVFGQATMVGTAPNFNTTDGSRTAEGIAAPAGVFVDRRDTVYVADAGNSRLVHVLRSSSVVGAAAPVSSVPVARGSLVSLYGSGLADTAESLTAIPLPRTLANREVVLNDDTIAPLTYVGPAQVNLMMPTTVPVGAQRIAVRTSDTHEFVAGGSVVTVNVQPGLFTATSDGRGQAAAVNADGTINGPSQPALRGAYVSLYGTGQGPTNPTVADGEPSPIANTVAIPTADGAACLTQQPSVCVAVGSAFGKIQYSGLTPGFAGLWQINVEIPSQALTGPAIPVRVVINNVSSNLVTLAIK